MNGFIYVMSNPSFKDGRVKIGISKQDPTSKRVEELYSTGVPEPFNVEYYAFVENYEAAEKIFHSSLDNKRPNKTREFFTCSVPEAIVVIRNYAKIKYEEVLYRSPEQIRQAEREKKRKENIERARIEKEQGRIRIQREKEDKERRERIKEEQLEKERKVESFKEKCYDFLASVVAIIVFIPACMLFVFLVSKGMQLLVETWFR